MANLNEDHLKSLTEAQLAEEQKTWTSEDWWNYYAKDGEYTSEELNAHIKEWVYKIAGEDEGNI